jgi:type I restriction-modification system DNA methylase subunit
MPIPQSFDDAFARVKELVAIFQQNAPMYLSVRYAEADARKDFIDKFWIALGWDVNHEEQTDPYKQEVKVERGVATSEYRKRADYAFLAPNYRDVRFFVEAKKPHAGIDTPLFYFQTIRYGWNSHVPISVLHDFEEMRVLDCRYKPDINTALGHAVLKYRYTDYLNEPSFRTIYHLFSREAVTNGSIQEFAKGLPKVSRKRAARGVGTDEHQSIDESFLQELDDFREELARGYKRKNPELDGAALTEVTQRTLDRLVFMRFLEDKLIESEPLIANLLLKGKSWENFISTSRSLDRVYNGIIFKEHPLLDNDKFKADERVFDKISRSLSHRESPYDFNSIPIHILGSIYERFLGKVIVATAKQAHVEDKPEVRKAGGVYYTPEYIVRYIVENTVGRLVEGKTPAQIQEMQFADIACGSGSFLLGVYDRLLRYHTDYYNRTKKNRDAGIKAGCIQKEDGTLQLSLLQKRQILLNNIYGVDIDPQAVEVAQLSLYLKLLEDETIASAKSQQRALHAALLPSLSKNIVCGNSLIGWDILDGKLFDSGEERKLNPMNFEDAFPEVMKRGGFDAIVGNPPWGAELAEDAKSYLLNRYPTVPSKTKDTYLYFVYRALQMLTSNGRFGFIIPNTWLLINNAADVRRDLLNYSLDEIIDHGDGVFKQATVESCTLILTNSRHRRDTCRVVRYRKGKRVVDHVVSKDIWRADEFCRIIIDLNQQTFQLLQKLKRNTKRFDEESEIIWGIKPYQVGYGEPPQTREVLERRIFHAPKKLGEEWKPLLVGSDVDRYLCEFPGDQYIKYGKWLMYPSNESFMLQPKILLRQTSDSLRACYDDQRYYCQNSVFIIHSDTINLKYLLALLNARLLQFVYSFANPQSSKVFAEVKPSVIKQLPIIDADPIRHDRIIQLVDQMLEAKKQVASARTERDKTFYESKCATLDRQIDELVYELYELTLEEIALVESAGQ